MTNLYIAFVVKERRKKQKQNKIRNITNHMRGYIQKMTKFEMKNIIILIEYDLIIIYMNLYIFIV